MTNCKNCTAEIASNFCPNCGQPSRLKRIDRHYIKHEIEHVAHFDRGILYTVKELLRAPGQSVQQYLSENRSRLVKPIIFIIVTSLVYSVINHYFHIEDQYVRFDATRKSSVFMIMRWVQGHYGYANIIMGVFIAFWTKTFFRKNGYNFFEILILLCFVMGISMLIFALFALLQGVTGIQAMQVAGYVGIGYYTWAAGQFFGKNKIMNYVKALFAYILGMISFFVVVFALGMIIDLIANQVK